MGTGGGRKYGVRDKGALKYIIIGAIVVLFVAFAIWAYRCPK